MSLESLILIPEDKANHAIYGFVFGLFVIMVCHLGKLPHYALTGIGAAGILGAVKEGMDWYENKQAIKADKPLAHDVDIWDFVATTSGGIVAALAAII